MAMTETICRSCMSDLVSHSINHVGWKNMTLKEMFEGAVSYQIASSEPQQFCEACARTLIEWHEFKYVCDKTQESLMLVKNETKPCSETVWCVGNGLESELELVSEAKCEVETCQDFVVKFQGYLRDFKGQGKHLMTCYTINAKSLEEFKDNLWLVVESQIQGEVIVTNDGHPIWTRDSPHKDDLSKFVEFYDKKAKKMYHLHHLTHALLQSWRDREVSLYIYRYSKSIKTKDIWNKVQELMNPTNSVQEESTIDHTKITQGLLQRLKITHMNAFPNATQQNWTMWVKYIEYFTPDRQETLLNETPPTQLMPFFDTQLNHKQIPALMENTVSFSFSVAARLKLARPQRFFIALGRFDFRGATIDEVKHSIWLAVRPYLGREAILRENDVPMWSDKETPDEDDLDKFVTIVDLIGKVSCNVNSINEKKLYQWESKKCLVMNIYQYSNSISTIGQLQMFKKNMFESRTEAWVETENIIERLKDCHSKNFVSFDWRMWAFNIQAHEKSQHETLLRREPPKELAHLFISLSHHNTHVQIEPSKSNNGSNGMSHQNIYALLRLSKEEVANKNKFKQCPFTGCTSVIQIQSFPSHFKCCKYNPHRVLKYRCPFKGCSRSYMVRHLHRSHLKSCIYNPDRESKPLRQCPYCTATVMSLDVHLASKHSGKQFICDLCGVAKSTKASLESHIMMIHLQVKYRCDKCTNEYKTKKSLQIHFERDHSDKLLDLKCKLCQYQTYCQLNLARHMKLNHDPNYKRAVCPECNQTFKTRNALKNHMRTHADTEFICKVCSHVSKTEQGLKCHMTLHEEWKYECPVCFIKRRSSYEVRTHCKRKHPDYKLPPKGTVLKKTSRLNGKRLGYFPEDEESS